MGFQDHKAPLSQALALGSIENYLTLRDHLAGWCSNAG